MPNDVNVSPRTLIECIVSARFWATSIGPYSAKMQAIADRYAISASLISTITGLAAWGMIAGSPGLWAQILVGLMAVATAAVTVIPKVSGYGQCAFNAATLSGEYGTVLGKLEDALDELLSGNPNAQAHARDAQNAFDLTRVKKQSLKPFPIHLQTLVDGKRKGLTDEEEIRVVRRKAELQGVA